MTSGWGVPQIDRFGLFTHLQDASLQAIQEKAFSLSVLFCPNSAFPPARADYQLSDPLFTSLDRRSKGHRLDGSTIYRLVREFSEAAGIDKIVSPHRIRHSAITAYLDASNGNIRAAQGLSRHANLNTLNRYDDNRHKYQAIATNTLADLV